MEEDDPEVELDSDDVVIEDPEIDEIEDDVEEIEETEPFKQAVVKEKSRQKIQ